MKGDQTTLKCAAAALIVVVLGIGVRLSVSEPGDVEVLARFEASSGLDVGPEAPWFLTGLHGDGAAFAVIAADPFGADIGHGLRIPSYRYSRAGYSWLSAALVLGQDQLLLLGLSLVGLGSMATVAWQAVRLRETLGLKAWLLLANPALYIGFVGDTAEPLAIALLTLALAYGSFLATFGLAIVRPDYLVGLLSNWRLVLSGALLGVAFRMFWVERFDDSMIGGSVALAWPMVGIIDASSPVGWLVIAAGLFTVVRGVVERDLSWVASGVLVICFSSVVYDSPTNAMRAAGLLPVLWAFGPRRVVGQTIPHIPVVDSS